MEFFKHDTNMRNDTKIKNLICAEGGFGYAVYNIALESIMLNVTEFTYACELEDAAKFIAHDLWCDRDSVVKVLSKCIELGLLDGDAENTISCKKILLRIPTNALDKNSGLYKAIVELKMSADLKRKETKQRRKKEPVKDATKDVKEQEHEQSEDSNRDMVSEPMKKYAELVYEIWEKNKLPKANGGLISFIQSDFMLAMERLRKKHLNSTDVIAACENYAKVIDLKRKKKTWWSAELSFDSFCKESIKNFLPDYFRFENYEKTDAPKKSFYASAVEESGCDRLKTEEVPF